VKYEINTNSRPVLIKVYLEVKLPQRLSIAGYDPDPAHNGTVYFIRSKQINGKEHLDPRNPIEIPMPITPDKLILNIDQENGGFGSYINVVKVDVVELPSTTVVFPKDVLEYYDFIKTYCQKANYKGPGFYVSRDENYVIWAKPNLDGDATPARVNRRTGLVKVNLEKFVPFTVYMKIFIMLHEFIHYSQQTTDETRCDLGALRIFLGMGYPKSEANYAMTKIFDNSPDAIRRVTILNNYIKNHDLKYSSSKTMAKR
jgi:hypothetical protein